MAKGISKKTRQSEPPVELLSVNAFAKVVGVDEKSIREHVRKGTFPKGCVYDEAGRKKMDKAKALAEWQAAGGGVSRRTKYGAAGLGGDDLDDTGAGSASERRAAKFLEKANESKAEAEHYRAKILELEFKELSKELVRRDDVYKEMFAKGAALREGLLRIPRVVIDAIMICKDREKNILTLEDAIETELLRLSDEPLTDDEEDDE